MVTLVIELRAGHFYKTYQIMVPPKTLGIETKSKSIIVCSSTGQLYSVGLSSLLTYLITK